MSGVSAPNKPAVRIVAEAELNHNGDVGLAKRMIEEAKRCGADLVKFQCYVAESFLSPRSPLLGLFAGVQLGRDQLVELRDHAAGRGIVMFATAIDLEGLRIVLALDLPIIKIDSTNITNIPMLQAVSAAGKPVILSTGAATLGEVDRAVNELMRGCNDITLLHCTVQYPAAPEHLNLRAIATLAAAFPSLAVGYSDHTVGSDAAVAAVALGATVLEKHFTMSRDLPGPDHGFSADPAMFADYVATVRKVESMLGTGRKVPTPVEELPRRRGRRYVTALADIPVGTTIAQDLVRSRRGDPNTVRPPFSIEPEHESLICGWRARKLIAAGAVIEWSDLEPSEGSG